MPMLRRARRRKADRRNWKKIQKLKPDTWLEVQGVKVSPHAVARAWERIEDLSAVEIVLRLGHIIEHPEHIKEGKGGRLVFDDGEYRVIISQKEYQVITTVIADKP